MRQKARQMENIVAGFLLPEEKGGGRLKGERREKLFINSFRAKEKKKCSCGRAGQLPAAAAAGNCYASSKMQHTALFGEAGSGPFLGTRKGGSSPASLRQARRWRGSASAGGISRIGCSIPRSTRSDSGAGGGRLPDAARGGCFLLPREPGEQQQCGASERSACRPR